LKTREYLAACLAFILLMFLIQMIQGWGLFVFSLFVVAASVWGFVHFIEGKRLSQISAVLVLIVTIVHFAVVGYALVHRLDISFNYEEYRSVVPPFTAETMMIPVERVSLGKFPQFMGTTSWDCDFDPLFFWAHNPQQRLLKIGRVTHVYDGSFNLANPSCYQYPEENDCCPGDLISVDDHENFEGFRSGGPYAWKIPLRQRSADRVSLLMVILCTAVVICASVKRIVAMRSKG